MREAADDGILAVRKDVARVDELLLVAVPDELSKFGRRHRRGGGRDGHGLLREADGSRGGQRRDERKSKGCRTGALHRRNMLACAARNLP